MGDSYEVVIRDVTSGINEARIEWSAKDLMTIAKGVTRTKWIEVVVSPLVGVGTFDVFIGGKIGGCQKAKRKRGRAG